MEILGSYWRAAALAFAAMGAGGCGGYTSDYVPPQDGRARVVWDDDRAVAIVPQAAPAPCMPAVRALGSEPARFVTYGGPRTYVVWRPGVVVVASGRTRVVPARPGRFGPRVAAAPVSRIPARPTAASSGSSPRSSGGSGGKSGNVPAEVAVVMAVAALITLPAITLGLALGRPEPSSEVAAAIDEVNAFNDLARVSDSPCAAPPESEEAAPEDTEPPPPPPPAPSTPPAEEDAPPAEINDDNL